MLPLSSRCFGCRSTIRGLHCPVRYLTTDLAFPTLNDILEELRKPGRDPREGFEAPAFREDVTEIGDLCEGMVLEGRSPTWSVRRLCGHRGAPGRARVRVAG